MQIKYKTEKICEILNSLSSLTGIRISFLNQEKSPVFKQECNDFCEIAQSKYGMREKCITSDKSILSKCEESGKYECHICHLGLYDSAMPVIKHNIVVGYLIMGRVRLKKTDISALNFNKELADLYERLPYFTEAQLISLKTLLSNIFFSNAIEINYNTDADRIDTYIKENMSKKITVSSLCSNCFISKNKLYKIINETFGCTVNDYVTNLRIEAAKELLLQTASPICNICEMVGIDNYTYFSKLFKVKTGISPSIYRKQAKR